MREIYLTSDDNNTFFVVMFEYRPHIVDAIKKIPQRKFDKETKAWYVRADHTTVGPVIRFADEFDFVLHAEVQAYIEKLKKPIDENISIPSLKLTLRDFQKIGVAKAIRFERCFIADEMGLGKAQTLNSKILTPTGWKKMGDISVGDTIINSNGLESIVTGVFDRGIRDVYEVIFNDGSKTITCDEHLWNIQPIYNKSRNFGFITKELKEFKDDLYTEDGNSKWFIPMIKPIHFNHIDVEIDPYLMGVILGDGNITKCVTISSNDDEMIENLKKIIDDSLYIKQKDKQNYIIKNKKPGRQKNKLKQSLNKLKLFGHKSEYKFIPHDYMYNSISFRESLLQGLLDTHGLITEDGSTIEYYTSSYQLKEDVKFLVQSLGGTAKELFKTPTFWHNDVNKKRLVSYTLRIKLPAEITPFRLKRKLNRCNADINGPYRAFKSVKYIGKEETRCISTSADDQLYVTDDCILTHNTCQAIAAVEKLNAYPCLVITPASLKLNWEKEVKMWTDRRPNVIEGLIKDVKDDNGNIIDYIEPDYSGDFVIINYDILARDKNKKKDVNDDDYSDERGSNDPEEKEDNFQSMFHKDFLKLKKFKSIIIDESHYCRNRKSFRTIAVQELAKEIRYRFALSGTPMINRPSELIPQLIMLDRLDTMGGFWHYAKRYCLPENAPILMSDFSNKNIKDIVVGDSVIGWKLLKKQRQIIPSKVIDVFCRKSKLQKIIMNNGDEIICTPDHLWFSGRYETQYEYMPAKTGRMGGRGKGSATGIIKICNIKHENEIDFESVDYMSGYILGSFRGDGHCIVKKTERFNFFKDEITQSINNHIIGISVKDIEIIDRIELFFKKLNIQSYSRHKRNDGLYNLSCTNKEFYDFISEIKLDSDNAKAGFLAGIYDTEGSGKVISQSINKNKNTYNLIKLCLDSFNINYIEKQNGMGFFIKGNRDYFISFWKLINPSVQRKFNNFIFKFGGKFVSNRIFVKDIIELEGYHDVYTIKTETGNYVAYGYGSKNCDAKEGRFGWDLSGFSNLRELHDKLIETCFIRRKKSDVLSELPEKQRSMIPLKIDNRQDYDEAKEDLIKWLSLTLKPKISGEVLSDDKLKQLADSQKKSIITRRINKKLLGAKKAETLVKIEYLKQLCARGKLAKFKEFVDNFIQSGEKLVIFATHKEIYQELIEEYKDISVHIVGGSSNKHKQDAVDKFQTDSKIKLFIGAIDAAGVGHTLTAASNVAFIEFGWTSATHDQAEDRCHRIGQKNFVNCHYFYGVDTIDEYVLELIDRKRKITGSATDGEIHSINDDDLEELINKFIS